MTIRTILVLTLVFCILWIQPARAEYPEKPITLVVPFGTGGDSDASARIWAKYAQEELGQPVLVVNKTGSGGLTGTVFAAQAKADGYTLFLGQAGPCIVMPLLDRTGSLHFNSFEYVTRFIRSNTGVVVHVNAPWNSLKEFQVMAQKNTPGNYIFSSPSAVSWLNLAFSSWAFQNDVMMRTVHYTSSAEAVSSINGKHGDLSFLFANNYEKLVDSGQLKLLALGTKSEKYPNVPTFNEQGYEGSFYGWSGIVVPKDVPQEIIDKLADVTQKISQNPVFIQDVKNLGFIPDNTSGKQWKDEVQEQYDTMKELLKGLGLISN